MELQGWLTVPQVAERKKVTREAVHRALKEGRLPGRKLGRFWVVREEDADNWHPTHGGNRRGKPGAE